MHSHVKCMTSKLVKQTRNLVFDRSVGIRKLSRQSLFLGIETSCDDTGVAVVNDYRHILSQVVISQTENIKFGGVLPTLAQKCHEKNIVKALNQVREELSWDDWSDIDCIGVTNRPGMVQMLEVGAGAALEIAREYNKPLIPIHHMEAHALTARLTDPSLEFPFLCLLASGGHCLLVWVASATKFHLMGENTDIAPGEMMDKIARRLRLVHVSPEWETLCGGAAIERMAACGGDPTSFTINIPIYRLPNPSCDFSFSGLRVEAEKAIAKLEDEHNVSGGDLLPHQVLADFCASVQHTTFKHLAVQCQRAIAFLETKGCVLARPRREKCPPASVLDTEIYPGAISNDYSTQDVFPTFVFSGGVASNLYIRKGLEYVLAECGWRTVCPPLNLCTDNGIMIAWAASERWRLQSNIILPEALPPAGQTLQVQPKSPLGNEDTSWRNKISKACPEVEKVDINLNYTKKTVSEEPISARKAN